MAELFTHNAAAVLALLGVLVGVIVTGGLTFANGWIMRKRDLDLKIWEKLLDRRIAAHETVIGLAIAMRRMAPLGGTDAAGELVRAPEVMMSKEAFDTWLVEFAEIIASGDLAFNGRQKGAQLRSRLLCDAFTLICPVLLPVLFPL
jgi:hypothetical protein